MIWLKIYGIFPAILLIALSPMSVRMQSDLVSTGLTVVAASTALVSFGYASICIAEIFVLYERTVQTGYDKGKKEGFEAGQAEGFRLGEEKCRNLKKTTPPQYCQEIKDAVTTILKEEEDRRVSEISITIAGLKVNTRNELYACLKLDTPGCTSAGCSIKTIGSDKFCVSDKLI